MIDTLFLLKPPAQGAKTNNFPKYHGAGSPEARGPMQLHRLHQFKVGPGSSFQ